MNEKTGQIAGFDALGLSAATLAAVSAKGFEAPTRIQAEVIPRLLLGQCDVIAQSQTGTGKTAAFGLPLVDRLSAAHGPVQALILVPTRELAVQVAEEINSLRGNKALHVVPMYGGQSYELQFRHLRQGVDILVGTPGRIIDHLKRGSLNLGTVKWVVLDEADEMLDMGFLEDIEAILGTCHERERMLLFSATMPQRIRSMSQTWMKNVEEVTIADTTISKSLTDQSYLEVLEQDKFEALCRIVDSVDTFYGMVFCRTKVECDRLYNRLCERAYDAEVIHGDLNQSAREKVLDAFRRKQVDILVCTDVAARGIDVQDLTHVINFSLPADPESYVHRIGRTGRAGKEGTAVTFVTPSEVRKLSFIRRGANSEIRKETIPSVEDILGQKKRRVLEAYMATLDDPQEDGVATSRPSSAITRDIAEKLVEAGRERGFDQTELLARILVSDLADELDGSRYGKITNVDSAKYRERSDFRDRGPRFGNREGGNEPWNRRDSGDGGGFRERAHSDGIRLYVARGRADGFTKPKLVSFLQEASGVRDRNVNEIDLREFYSFVTVPADDAAKLMAALGGESTPGPNGKPGKPIVRSADPSEQSAPRPGKPPFKGGGNHKPGGFRKFKSHEGGPAHAHRGNDGAPY